MLLSPRLLLALPAMMLILAGCSIIPQAHPAATVRPAGTRVARVVATPSATGVASTAVQQYSCAVIPVADELRAAGSRYSDAQSAVASQLTDSATLDMDDSIRLLRQAQAQLAALTPTSLLARYQQLLQRADDQYLAGAAPLRQDFANSDTAAAKRDSKTFEQGTTYLNQAEAERTRIGRQVRLSDEGSPRCSQAYLRHFLSQQGSSTAPAPTVALEPVTPRPTARTAPTSRPRVRPIRPPRVRPTAKAVRTHKPKPVPRATFRPVPVPRTLSAAERSFVAGANTAISDLDTATFNLSTAFQLISRDRPTTATPLIDGAAIRLDGTRSAMSRLRAPNTADRRIKKQVQDAIASDYVAARNLRLALIDLAGRNTALEGPDLKAARLALERAARQSKSGLSLLKSRTRGR